MIFGVGTDLLEVARVERVWNRFGERFATRVLLDAELELFAESANRVRFLAMRFAAKEAIVKAMGTGFAHGMWVRDVGTVPNELGQPQIIYSARGAAMCARLGIGNGFLSLSDEAGLILAFAVLLRK
jgi:holo-[acyl-carrier protein] synthase